MGLPTKSEKYAEIIEHLIRCQEAAAMIAHLVRDDDRLHAQGWLAVSEMFKRTQHQITELATRGAFH
jgi:hypothetical protein